VRRKLRWLSRNRIGGADRQNLAVARRHDWRAAAWLYLPGRCLLYGRFGLAAGKEHDSSGNFRGSADIFGGVCRARLVQTLLKPDVGPESEGWPNAAYGSFTDSCTVGKLP